MLFEPIDPVLMGRRRIDKGTHGLGQFVTFLVDLLNPFVGNVPVERFLTRGRPPEDFFPLVRQQKGETANEALGGLHEHVFALKGFERGGVECVALRFDAALGFHQNDRLEAPAHAVLVASGSQQEGQTVDPRGHVVVVS
jgi:hypothetical protein